MSPFKISTIFFRSIANIVLLAFMGTMAGPLPMARADDFRLPTPGEMVHLSPEFNPPILKGIKVHSENPFRFDFILDQGDSIGNVIARSEASKQSYQGQLKTESAKLIKYFLASLTIPEKDLWVNLSPYEKDRIIPQSFGLTEMGRDLLAEDYMLKQITASLIYPEGIVGKKFWKRIYSEAAQRFGTTNVSVNTFNKVWILPEKAVVYENAKAGAAYVVESRLKVMLEQDYLSLEKHEGIQSKVVAIRGTSQLGSEIVREIVIPELVKEINENKNFSQLRQVYNSLILAAWYKKKIKDSILAQVYEDKNKVTGLSSPNFSIRDPEHIYQQYLKAFKKGVYNYIKEDIDPSTQQSIARKYFSGGENFTDLAMQSALEMQDVRKVKNLPSLTKALIVSIGLQDAAMQSDLPRISDNDVSFSVPGFKNVLIRGLRIFPAFKKEMNLGQAEDYSEPVKTIEVQGRKFDLVRKRSGSNIVFTLSKEQFERLVELKGWQLQVDLPEVNDNDVSFSRAGFNAVLINGQDIWPAFKKEMSLGEAQDYQEPVKTIEAQGHQFDLVPKRSYNKIIFTLSTKQFKQLAALVGWQLKLERSFNVALPQVNDNDVSFSMKGFNVVLINGFNIWPAFKVETRLGEARDYPEPVKTIEVQGQEFNLVRKLSGTKVVFTLSKEQFGRLVTLKGWRLKSEILFNEDLPEVNDSDVSFSTWGFQAYLINGGGVWQTFKEEMNLGEARDDTESVKRIEVQGQKFDLVRKRSGTRIVFTLSREQFERLAQLKGWTLKAKRLDIDEGIAKVILAMRGSGSDEETLIATISALVGDKYSRSKIEELIERVNSKATTDAAMRSTDLEKFPHVDKTREIIFSPNGFKGVVIGAQQRWPDIKKTLGEAKDWEGKIRTISVQGQEFILVKKLSGNAVVYTLDKETFKRFAILQGWKLEEGWPSVDEEKDIVFSGPGFARILVGGQRIWKNGWNQLIGVAKEWDESTKTIEVKGNKFVLIKKKDGPAVVFTMDRKEFDRLIGIEGWAAKSTLPSVDKEDDIILNNNGVRDRVESDQEAWSGFFKSIGVAKDWNENTKKIMVEGHEFFLTRKLNGTLIVFTMDKEAFKRLVDLIGKYRESLPEVDRGNDVVFSRAGFASALEGGGNIWSEFKDLIGEAQYSTGITKMITIKDEEFILIRKRHETKIVFTLDKKDFERLVRLKGWQYKKELPEVDQDNDIVLSSESFDDLLVGGKDKWSEIKGLIGQATMSSEETRTIRIKDEEFVVSQKRNGSAISLVLNRDDFDRLVRIQGWKYAGLLPFVNKENDVVMSSQGFRVLRGGQRIWLEFRASVGKAKEWNESTKTIDVRGNKFILVKKQNGPSIVFTLDKNEFKKLVTLKGWRYVEELPEVDENNDVLLSPEGFEGIIGAQQIWPEFRGLIGEAEEWTQPSKVVHIKGEEFVLARKKNDWAIVFTLSTRDFERLVILEGWEYRENLPKVDEETDVICNGLSFGDILLGGKKRWVEIKDLLGEAKDNLEPAKSIRVADRTFTFVRKWLGTRIVYVLDEEEFYQLVQLKGWKFRIKASKVDLNDVIFSSHGFNVLLINGSGIWRKFEKYIGEARENLGPTKTITVAGSSFTLVRKQSGPFVVYTLDKDRFEELVRLKGWKLRGQIPKVGVNDVSFSLLGFNDILINGAKIWLAFKEDMSLDKAKDYPEAVKTIEVKGQKFDLVSKRSNNSIVFTLSKDQFKQLAQLKGWVLKVKKLGIDEGIAKVILAMRGSGSDEETLIATISALVGDKYSRSEIEGLIERVNAQGPTDAAMHSDLPIVDENDVPFSEPGFKSVIASGSRIWTEFRKEIGEAKDWPKPTKLIEVNGKKFELVIKKRGNKIMFTLNRKEFYELAKLKEWQFNVNLPKLSADDVPFSPDGFKMLINGHNIWPDFQKEVGDAEHYPESAKTITIEGRRFELIRKQSGVRIVFVLDKEQFRELARLKRWLYKVNLPKVGANDVAFSTPGFVSVIIGGAAIWLEFQKEIGEAKGYPDPTKVIKIDGHSFELTRKESGNIPVFTLERERFKELARLKGWKLKSIAPLTSTNLPTVDKNDVVFSTNGFKEVFVNGATIWGSFKHLIGEARDYPDTTKVVRVEEKEFTLVRKRLGVISVFTLNKEKIIELAQIKGWRLKIKIPGSEDEVSDNDISFSQRGFERELNDGQRVWRNFKREIGEAKNQSEVTKAFNLKGRTFILIRKRTATGTVFTLDKQQFREFAQLQGWRLKTKLPAVAKDDVSFSKFGFEAVLFNGRRIHSVFKHEYGIGEARDYTEDIIIEVNGKKFTLVRKESTGMILFTLGREQFKELARLKGWKLQAGLPEVSDNDVPFSRRGFTFVLINGESLWSDFKKEMGLGEAKDYKEPVKTIEVQGQRFDLVRKLSNNKIVFTLSKDQFKQLAQLKGWTLKTKRLDIDEGLAQVILAMRDSGSDEETLIETISALVGDKYSRLEIEGLIERVSAEGPTDAAMQSKLPKVDDNDVSFSEPGFNDVLINGGVILRAFKKAMSLGEAQDYPEAFKTIEVQGHQFGLVRKRSGPKIVFTLSKEKFKLLAKLGEWKLKSELPLVNNNDVSFSVSGFDAVLINGGEVWPAFKEEMKLGEAKDHPEATKTIEVIGKKFILIRKKTGVHIVFTLEREQFKQLAKLKRWSLNLGLPNVDENDVVFSEPGLGSREIWLKFEREIGKAKDYPKSTKTIEVAGRRFILTRKELSGHIVFTLEREQFKELARLKKWQLVLPKINDNDVVFSRPGFDAILYAGQKIWLAFEREIGKAKDYTEATRTIEVAGKKFILIRKRSGVHSVFTLSKEQFKKLAELKEWQLKPESSFNVDLPQVNDNDVSFLGSGFNAALINGVNIWRVFKEEMSLGEAKDYPESVKTIEIQGQQFDLMRKTFGRSTIVFTLDQKQFKQLAQLKGWKSKTKRLGIDEGIAKIILALRNSGKATIVETLSSLYGDKYSKAEIEEFVERIDLEEGAPQMDRAMNVSLPDVNKAQDLVLTRRGLAEVFVVPAFKIEEFKAKLGLLTDAKDDKRNRIEIKEYGWIVERKKLYGQIAYVISRENASDIARQMKWKLREQSVSGQNESFSEVDPKKDLVIAGRSLDEIFVGGYKRVLNPFKKQFGLLNNARYDKRKLIPVKLNGKDWEIERKRSGSAIVYVISRDAINDMGIEMRWDRKSPEVDMEKDFILSIPIFKKIFINGQIVIAKFKSQYGLKDDARNDSRDSIPVIINGRHWNIGRKNNGTRVVYTIGKKAVEDIIKEFKLVQSNQELPLVDPIRDLIIIQSVFADIFIGGSQGLTKFKSRLGLKESVEQDSRNSIPVKLNQTEWVVYKKIKDAYMYYTIDHNAIADIAEEMGWSQRDKEIIEVDLSRDLPIARRQFEDEFIAGQKAANLFRTRFGLKSDAQEDERNTIPVKINGKKWEIRRKTNGSRMIYVISREAIEDIAQEMQLIRRNKEVMEVSPRDLVISGVSFDQVFLGGQLRADVFKDKFGLKSEAKEDNRNVIPVEINTKRWKVRRKISSGNFVYTIDQHAIDDIAIEMGWKRKITRLGLDEDMAKVILALRSSSQDILLQTLFTLYGDKYTESEIKELVERVNAQRPTDAAMQSNLPKVDDNDVSFSQSGFNAVLIGGNRIWPVFRKEMSLGEAKDHPEPVKRVKVGRHSFDLVRKLSGGSIVFSLPKRQFELLAQLKGWDLKFEQDHLRVNDNDVSLSAPSFRDVLIGGNRIWPNFKKEMSLGEARDYPNPVKMIEVQGHQFYLMRKRSGPGIVFTLSKEQFKLLAKLKGWKLQSDVDFPEVNDKDVSFSIQGFKDVLIGGERIWTNFKKEMSLGEAKDYPEAIKRIEVQGHQFGLVRMRFSNNSIVFTLSKEQFELLTKLRGWKLKSQRFFNEGLPEVNDNDVSFSKPNFMAVLIDGQRIWPAFKEEMSLGEAKDHPESIKKIDVEGHSFDLGRKLSSNMPVFTLSKEQFKLLAKLKGWKLQSELDLPQVNDKDVSFSTLGFKAALVNGGPIWPTFKKEMGIGEAKDYPEAAKRIKVQGQEFDLVRKASGVRIVFTLSKDQFKQLAQLKGWKLKENKLKMDEGIAQVILAMRDSGSDEETLIATIAALVGDKYSRSEIEELIERVNAQGPSDAAMHSDLPKISDNDISFSVSGFNDALINGQNIWPDFKEEMSLGEAQDYPEAIKRIEVQGHQFDLVRKLSSGRIVFTLSREQFEQLAQLKGWKLQGDLPQVNDNDVSFSQSGFNAVLINGHRIWSSFKAEISLGEAQDYSDSVKTIEVQGQQFNIMRKRSGAMIVFILSREQFKLLAQLKGWKLKPQRSLNLDLPQVNDNDVSFSGRGFNNVLINGEKIWPAFKAEMSLGDAQDYPEAVKVVEAQGERFDLVRKLSSSSIVFTLSKEQFKLLAQLRGWKLQPQRFLNLDLPQVNDNDVSFSGPGFDDVLINGQNIWPTFKEEMSLSEAQDYPDPIKTLEIKGQQFDLMRKRSGKRIVFTLSKEQFEQLAELKEWELKLERYFNVNLPTVSYNDVSFSQLGFKDILINGGGIWSAFKEEMGLGEAKDYQGPVKTIEVQDHQFDLVRKRSGNNIVFTLSKDQFKQLAQLKGWKLKAKRLDIDEGIAKVILAMRGSGSDEETLIETISALVGDKYSRSEIEGFIERVNAGGPADAAMRSDLPKVNDNDVSFSVTGFDALLRNGQKIWKAFQKEVGEAKDYEGATKSLLVGNKTFELVSKKTKGGHIIFTLPKDEFNELAKLKAWPLQKEVPEVNDNDVVFSVKGFGAVLMGGWNIWKAFQKEVGEAEDYEEATKPLLARDKTFELVRKRNGTHIVFTLPKDRFNELAQLKDWPLQKGLSEINDNDVVFSHVGFGAVLRNGNRIWKAFQNEVGMAEDYEGEKKPFKAGDKTFQFVRKKNGKHIVFTLSKDEFNKLAELKAWPLQKELPEVNDNDVVFSRSGFGTVLRGSWNRWKDFQKEVGEAEDYEEATKPFKVGDKTFELVRKKNGNQVVFTLPKDEFKELAQFKDWPLKNKLPEVSNNDVIFSQRGFNTVLYGGEGIWLKFEEKIGQAQNHPGAIKTIAVEGQSFNLVRKQSGSSIVFTLDKEQFKQLAQLKGWVLKKNELNIDEGLAKIMLAMRDSSKDDLIKTLSALYGDKYSRSEIEGLIERVDAQGPTDAAMQSHLPKVKGWKFKGEIPEVSDEDVVFSTPGFGKVLVGGIKIWPAFRKEMRLGEAKDYPNSVKTIEVQGKRFDLVRKRSGNQMVFTLSNAQFKLLAQLREWKLKLENSFNVDLPKVGDNDVSFSQKRFNTVLINGESIWQAFKEEMGTAKAKDYQGPVKRIDVQGYPFDLVRKRSGSKIVFTLPKKQFKRLAQLKGWRLQPESSFNVDLPQVSDNDMSFSQSGFRDVLINGERIWRVLKEEISLGEAQDYSKSVKTIEILGKQFDLVRKRSGTNIVFTLSKKQFESLARLKEWKLKPEHFLPQVNDNDVSFSKQGFYDVLINGGNIWSSFKGEISLGEAQDHPEPVKVIEVQGHPFDLVRKRFGSHIVFTLSKDQFELLAKLKGWNLQVDLPKVNDNDVAFSQLGFRNVVIDGGRIWPAFKAEMSLGEARDYPDLVKRIEVQGKRFDLVRKQSGKRIVFTLSKDKFELLAKLKGWKLQPESSFNVGLPQISDNDVSFSGPGFDAVMIGNKRIWRSFKEEISLGEAKDYPEPAKRIEIQGQQFYLIRKRSGPGIVFTLSKDQFKQLAQLKGWKLKENKLKIDEGIAQVILAMRDSGSDEETLIATIAALVGDKYSRSEIEGLIERVDAQGPTDAAMKSDLPKVAPDDVRFSKPGFTKVIRRGNVELNKLEQEIGKAKNWPLPSRAYTVGTRTFKLVRKSMMGKILFTLPMAEFKELARLKNWELQDLQEASPDDVIFSEPGFKVVIDNGQREWRDLHRLIGDAQAYTEPTKSLFIEGREFVLIRKDRKSRIVFTLPREEFNELARLKEWKLKSNLEKVDPERDVVFSQSGFHQSLRGGMAIWAEYAAKVGNPKNYPQQFKLTKVGGRVFKLVRKESGSRVVFTLPKEDFKEFARLKGWKLDERLPKADMNDVIFSSIGFNKFIVGGYDLWPVLKLEVGEAKDWPDKTKIISVAGQDFVLVRKTVGINERPCFTLNKVEFRKLAALKEWKLKEHKLDINEDIAKIILAMRDSSKEELVETLFSLYGDQYSRAEIEGLIERVNAQRLTDAAMRTDLPKVDDNDVSFSSPGFAEALIDGDRIWRAFKKAMNLGEAKYYPDLIKTIEIKEQKFDFVRKRSGPGIVFTLSKEQFKQLATLKGWELKPERSFNVDLLQVNDNDVSFSVKGFKAVLIYGVNIWPAFKAEMSLGEARDYPGSGKRIEVQGQQFNLVRKRSGPNIVFILSKEQFKQLAQLKGWKLEVDLPTVKDNDVSFSAPGFKDVLINGKNIWPIFKKEIGIGEAEDYPDTVKRIEVDGHSFELVRKLSGGIIVFTLSKEQFKLLARLRGWNLQLDLPQVNDNDVSFSKSGFNDTLINGQEIWPAFKKEMSLSEAKDHPDSAKTIEVQGQQFNLVRKQSGPQIVFTLSKEQFKQLAQLKGWILKTKSLKIDEGIAQVILAMRDSGSDEETLIATISALVGDKYSVSQIEELIERVNSETGTDAAMKSELPQVNDNDVIFSKKGFGAALRGGEDIWKTFKNEAGEAKDYEGTIKLFKVGNKTFELMRKGNGPRIVFTLPKDQFKELAKLKDWPLQKELAEINDNDVVFSANGFGSVLRGGWHIWKTFKNEAGEAKDYEGTTKPLLIGGKTFELVRKKSGKHIVFTLPKEEFKELVQLKDWPLQEELPEVNDNDVVFSVKSLAALLRNGERIWRVFQKEVGEAEDYERATKPFLIGDKTFELVRKKSGKYIVFTLPKDEFNELAQLKDWPLQKELPDVNDNDVVFSFAGFSVILRNGQNIWKAFENEVGEAKDYEGATKPLLIGGKTFELVRKKNSGNIVFTLPKDEFNELAQLKDWPLQKEFPEVNDNDVVFSGRGFGKVLRDGENIWKALQNEVGAAEDYERAIKPFLIGDKTFELVRKKKGSAIVFTLLKDEFKELAQLKGWVLKKNKLDIDEGLAQVILAMRGSDEETLIETISALVGDKYSRAEIEGLIERVKAQGPADAAMRSHLPRVDDNDVSLSGPSFNNALINGFKIWRAFKEEISLGEAKDYSVSVKIEVQGKKFDLVRKRSGHNIVFTLLKEQFKQLAKLKGWQLKPQRSLTVSFPQIDDNDVSFSGPGFAAVLYGGEKIWEDFKDEIGKSIDHPGAIKKIIVEGRSFNLVRKRRGRSGIVFTLNKEQFRQLAKSKGWQFNLDLSEVNNNDVSFSRKGFDAMLYGGEKIWEDFKDEIGEAKDYPGTTRMIQVRGQKFILIRKLSAGKIVFTLDKEQFKQLVQLKGWKFNAELPQVNDNDVSLTFKGLNAVLYGGKAIWEEFKDEIGEAKDHPELTKTIEVQGKKFVLIRKQSGARIVFTLEKGQFQELARLKKWSWNPELPKVSHNDVIFSHGGFNAVLYGANKIWNEFKDEIGQAKDHPGSIKTIVVEGRQFNLVRKQSGPKIVFTLDKEQFKRLAQLRGWKFNLEFPEVNNNDVSFSVSGFNDVLINGENIWSTFKEEMSLGEAKDYLRAVKTIMLEGQQFALVRKQSSGMIVFTLEKEQFKQLAQLKGWKLKEKKLDIDEGLAKVILAMKDSSKEALIETLSSLYGGEYSISEIARFVDEIRGDRAMRGGVDFTADKTPLEIQNNGQSLKFHLDGAQLAQLQNAPGFVPVIIDIQPLRDLRAFLEV